jgi:cyanate lyase
MERILDIKDSTQYDLDMAKHQYKTLTDQLRQAIDDSGLTRYRIAKETGLSEATLSKFYLGQRGLSMEAMNALGERLQLTIQLGRKPDKKGT